MSFLARLVSDNSSSLEKFELGALSSQQSARVFEFLFMATCALDLTFLVPLIQTFGYPELGAQIPY